MAGVYIGPQTSKKAEEALKNISGGKEGRTIIGGYLNAGYSKWDRITKAREAICKWVTLWNYEITPPSKASYKPKGRTGERKPYMLLYFEGGW